jgi:N-acetylglucosamine kinase-like BadF-type ATPase
VAGEIIVGVDGGGTKTDAVVVDRDGRLLGSAAAGASNWESVGRRAMAEALQAAVHGALTAAGVAASDVAASSFAMAGFDWPSDRARIEPALVELGLGGPTLLVNDAFAALRAGIRHRHGCVSIAGTGGSNAGRNRAGDTFRTFAGSVGEPAGATSVVAGALEAIAQAHFGQRPATSLASLFVASTGAASVEDLFEGMARGGMHVGPNLAPVVFEAATSGDRAAREVVREVGTRHGDAVIGVARRLDMLDDRFEIVRAGGLHVAGNASFDAAFSSVVAREAPGAEVLVLDMPSVFGSALLAIELLDGDTDADTAHDTLRRSSVQG